MSFAIHVSGAAESAVFANVPALVADMVASGITAEDPALWGADAESEAARRLGWTEAVAVSRPLVPEIIALRDQLRAAGVTHILLAGMGGSSLAAEVITRTANVELTILDCTAPGQVRAALGDRLAESAIVISSKSGSTLETDSLRRIYLKAFQDAGIDPLERIIFVTDPGSAMETSARADGYRVFTADPDVGGRYSALTAFGLVPAGLAGVDIDALLTEAETISLELSIDDETNPALILGAAIAGSAPPKNKLGLVPDGTHLVGFPDWAEQLIAESTGKQGTGILPVVLDPLSAELGEKLPDLQIVRLVDDANAHHMFRGDRHDGEILVSGSLGAQFLVWEYAVAVAGRILGINPFDQPDVESAKSATRGLLTEHPEHPEPAAPAFTAPAFTAEGMEIRGSDGLLAQVDTLSAAIDRLIAELPEDGYLSIQAYVDRVALPQLAGLRDMIAARAHRPVTFGWGPRFLHSTGQFHKGGPACGVFLQFTETMTHDLEIPGSPFTLGELIRAQADGDAAVLGEHGRPVLSINLSDPEENVSTLFDAVTA